jgi:hypothetical protein
MPNAWRIARVGLVLALLVTGIGCRLSFRPNINGDVYVIAIDGSTHQIHRVATLSDQALRTSIAEWIEAASHPPSGWYCRCLPPVSGHGIELNGRFFLITTGSVDEFDARATIIDHRHVRHQKFSEERARMTAENIRTATGISILDARYH